LVPFFERLPYLVWFNHYFFGGQCLGLHLKRD
jgi:hypothetical protein